MLSIGSFFQYFFLPELPSSYRKAAVADSEHKHHQCGACQPVEIDYLPLVRN